MAQLVQLRAAASSLAATRGAPSWEPLTFEASLPLVRSWRHPYFADLHFAVSGPAPGARSAFSVQGVEMTQLHASHGVNWKACVHQRKGVHHGEVLN